jgi:hypothetical protein
VICTHIQDLSNYPLHLAAGRVVREWSRMKESAAGERSVELNRYAAA